MPIPDPIMSQGEALAAVSAGGLRLEAIPAEIATWIDYMVNQAEIVAGQIEADYYAQLAASITSPMDEKALAAAREAWRNDARQRARTLVTGMTREQLKAIGQTIAQGLADGIGPNELARRLDDVTALDAQRAAQFGKTSAYLETLDLPPDQLAKMQAGLYEQLLRERKETIAATEARYATEEALAENAKARGAQFKVWITTSDDRVSDECQANEAAGPIPINDVFPSGDDKPPQHPNCRCSLAFYTDETQLGSARERAQARAAKTAEAKEAQK